ncbi:photoreceptor cilium actin regulator [Petromyzon marinus]|uniref:Photoreceptor cilium actin regulator n=1 Tax=Petromyzon marinus TaxID=7757 RepID=A0AAJ7SR80_PETMA|nr:photoreceptor cilium actin regulator [Petromyzon marinus]XP_032804055.1 photoreceptor cilium actin regulator [Petromyzon marinus]
MGCTPSHADVLPLPGRLGLTCSDEARDGTASERGSRSDGVTTSSGRRGDDGEHTADDSDADDGHVGCYVPREKDIMHVCVEERLRERIVNSASLVMSEVIAGQPAFAEDLIAKIKASSKVDDFECHCPAVPENGGETREDGNPERERHPSEADGQEERSKIDFPDGMVEAHKAVYEYLNHTLHDYDDMMKSADQIVETQQSLQQMISFLFFKCEEINSTMQSATLTGEALLKSLKFGLSTQCSDKMEGLDLPQQVLRYSVNKLQGITDSTNSTTSGTLNLIVGYMKSAHEKLQEKLIAKMRLDASVAAVMAQLALHAMGAAPSPSAEERAAALSEDSGIAADSESLSELSTDSPGSKHACARRNGRRSESRPPSKGHAFAYDAVCQLEGTEPPGNRSMSHHCALEKQFKDVFYPPQISMFAESRDTESAVVGHTAIAPLDRGTAEQGRTSFLRSLDALADEIVDEAHVEVGVLDAMWDRKPENERQIDFAKQHVMQIVGNSSEMDELVLKLKEAISSRILFMSPGPPDPEWSEEEGKLQSGKRPKTAQASPSKGTNRRRSRSADSLANQEEDVTLRELHRVQKSIAKCLETTFQTAKQSVLMDKQRRPKISSAAQGSQPRSSRIKTSLDKGFSVLPNHGVLKGNKNEPPKSNKISSLKKSGPLKAIIPHAEPSLPEENNEPHIPLSRVVPVITPKTNSSRNPSMPSYSSTSCIPFKPKLFNAVGVLPPLPTRYRLLKPVVCPDSLMNIDDGLIPPSQHSNEKKRGDSSYMDISADSKPPKGNPPLRDRQDSVSQARPPSPPSHHKNQGPAKWRKSHIVNPDGQSSPPTARQASPPPHCRQPSPPTQHKDSSTKSQTGRESLAQHAAQANLPRTRQPSPPRTRHPSPPRTTQASPPSSRQPSPPRSRHPSPPRTTQASPPRIRQASPPRTRYPSPPRTTQTNPPSTREHSPPCTKRATPPGTGQPSPPPQCRGASPPSQWRRVTFPCPDKQSSPPLTEQASPPIIRQPSPPSQRRNASPPRQWRQVHLPSTEEQASPPLLSNRHFKPLSHDGQLSPPPRGACPSTPPWATEPSQHLQRRQAFRRLPSPPLQPGHSTPCPLPSPPGEQRKLPSPPLGQRKLPSPPLGQRKLPSPPPHGRQLSPCRLRQLSPAIQEKMGTFLINEPAVAVPRSLADEATSECRQSPKTNAGSIFCSAPSSMFKAKNMTDDQSLYNNASSQYQTDQHQQQLAHALCKSARSAAARASKEECEDDSSGLSGKYDSADDGGRADAGLECSCVAQGNGDPRKLDVGPDFLVQGRGICSLGPTEEN